MEETIAPRKCKLQNRFRRLNYWYRNIATNEKGLRVIEISIAASLNRDCRNTRRANICLHSPDAAKLEFSGREYICGGNLVTYLLVTRDRVRAMYVSAAYRLSVCPVDRINWQRDTLGSLLHILQPFSTSKKYFLSVEFDQFCRELVYTFERYSRSAL